MNSKTFRTSLCIIWAFSLIANARQLGPLEYEPTFSIDDARAAMRGALDSLALADLLMVYRDPGKIGVTQELVNAALKDRFMNQSEWPEEDLALVSQNQNAIQDELLKNLEHTLLRYVALEPSQDLAKDMYALFLAYNQAIIRFPHSEFGKYFPVQHVLFFEAAQDAVEALTSEHLPDSWRIAYDKTCVTGFDLDKELHRWILRGFRSDIYRLINTDSRREKLRLWHNELHRAKIPFLYFLQVMMQEDFIQLYFLPAFRTAKIILEEDRQFGMSPEEVFTTLSKGLWERVDLPCWQRPITRAGDTEQVKYRCRIGHEELRVNPYTQSVKRLLLGKMNG